MPYIPVLLPISVLISTSWDESWSQKIIAGIPISISIISLGAAIELFLYSEYKNYVNQEKGIISELVFLKQGLKVLEETLELYFDLGYNKEKYYQYYR